VDDDAREDGMHRQINALVDRQAGWAGPLGEKAQHVLGDLFATRRPIKDLLNGTWFGHPVHPAVTDVPVGAMTMAALFDVTGHDGAADVAVATGLAGMVGAAATGAADAVDAYGRPQVFATVHATCMAASFAAYGASLLLRLGPRGGRPLARTLAFAGYAAMTAGSYVGGDLTYRLGNQVDRHAFASGGTKWKALDVGEVPAGTLVRAKMGNDPLVLYRESDGAPIRALHATCAHAGGPLDKGTVVDGCVQCPWHQSRFRLEDGHVVQGPAVFDQPVFEVRETAEGGLEARRAVGAH
jgi:nitrite reductase/ring-hydroxylating ferredoxin subunit